MAKFLKELLAQKTVLNKKTIQPEERKSQNASLNSQIACDLCGEYDLCGRKGGFWHCNDCPDFDLCDECYHNPAKMHKHDRQEWFSYETKPLQVITKEILDKSFSLGSLLLHTFSAHSHRKCFGVRCSSPSDTVQSESCNWSWKTFDEVFEVSKNLSKGLNALGIAKKGSFVSICAECRPEFFYADFACVFGDMVSVPIATGSDVSSAEFILRNSETSIVICSKVNTPIFLQLASCLQWIVQIEPFDDEPPVQLEGLKVLSMEEVILAGSKVPLSLQLSLESRLMNGEDTVEAARKRLLTINYTSGSTGTPKGAMISDRHWRDFCGSIYPYPPNVLLNFMPCSHVTGRSLPVMNMVNGGRTGFHTGDLADIFQSTSTLRPTFFLAPPRLWNIVFGEYNQAIASGKSELSVLAELRKRFGDRLEAVVTGGAPTSKATFQFMKKLFPQVALSDGYGTTETGAIFSNGEIAPDVEFKLVEVPELGYSPLDTPHPRGELYVKTSTMMMGYFKDEAKTKETIDDEGWYHTGDIVEQVGPQKLSIIDRKKNVFKLSQGEFISAETLENFYVGDKYIDQIFIYGESMRDFIVSIVVPNEEAILKWWRSKTTRTTSEVKQNVSYAEVLERPEVSRKMLRVLVKQARRNNLKPFEIPRAVFLDHRRFTIENGNLTNTLKLSRPGLLKFYKRELEQLYSKKFKEESEEGEARETTGEVGNKKPEERVSNDLEPYPSLRKKVMNVFREVLGDEIVSSDITIAEAGGDSLSLVRIQSILKNKYELDLPVSVLLSGKTLGEIAQFFDDLQGSEQFTATLLGPTSEPNFFHQEVERLWNDHKYLFENPIRGSKREIRNVFLTGATGYLGLHLLHTLLENTDSQTKVFCLIRARNESFGLLKLTKALNEVWSKVHETDLQIGRVVPVIGDLAHENFGLTVTEFQSLSETIDTIYHNGALVNTIKSYEAHLPANVLGTLTALRLAVTSEPKSFHYTSTAGILMDDTEENVDISSMSESLLSRLSGYTQSKWVAEILVHKARERGVQATIFRPGVIAPCSITGHTNLNDWVMRFLCGSIQMGYFPDTESAIDLCPVDFVAKALVFITSQQFETAVRTPAFHLVNPHEKTSLSTLYQSALSFGFKLKMISEDKWIEYVGCDQRVGEKNMLYLLRPVFSSGFPSGNQGKWEARNTLQALALSTPRIEAASLQNQDYWKIIFAWLTTHGHLPT